ncbi:MAG: hypothetical protein AAF353_07995 [Pseudomonadota bacterium]
MSIQQVIEIYLKGWELGDGELSLSATADSFSYDDPNTGRIPREEFVQFVEDFKTAAVEMGATKNARPFLKYTDTVIQQDGKSATVWCWWHAVGTELQGSARILVGENGVLHEKIAYFSRLPE